MPRQNRVTPFSRIIATPARGTLMGNRGCLHNEQGQIRRSHRGKRWILCLLDFKGRRRTIMAPGQYTELFFLDEATGLAAGHRPCAECQRPRYDLFAQAWTAAHGQATRPTAVEMDRVLHGQRTGQDTAHEVVADLHSLPDGVFVTPDDINAYLWWQGRLLFWQPDGYQPVQRALWSDGLKYITPPATVRVLAAGYPVSVHPSVL